MPTKIAWTDESWNPVTGCSPVSEGCAHCYAEKLSHRFGWSWDVTLHPDRLEIPLHWRKPRMVFVPSLGDLFHEDVPDGFLYAVWKVMAETPWHTYQVLTKRPARMQDFATRWSDLSGESLEPQLVRGPQATRERHPSGRGQLFAAWLEEIAKSSGGEPPPGAAWPTFDWMEGPRWWPMSPLPNVILMVSAENQKAADERVPKLLATPAAVRGVSLEPLLGPLDLTPWLGSRLIVKTEGHAGHLVSGTANVGLRGLEWVIVGGESGGPPERRLVERCDICTEAGCKNGKLGPDVSEAIRHESDRGTCYFCGCTGWRPKDDALAWVIDIRMQCHAAGVPFYFKQWGPRAGQGTLLDGREHREMPEVRA